MWPWRWIAAWLPVMLTATIRIVSALGATDAPIEMLVAQHYAMGMEVLITSLGVFDRLLAIRRQRDLAGGVRSLASRQQAELTAHHEPDDAVQRRLRHGSVAHVLAVAQHRVAVANLEDFFEPVGDEDAMRCKLDKNLEFVVLPTRR